jgi:hypothetical protein
MTARWVGKLHRDEDVLRGEMTDAFGMITAVTIRKSPDGGYDIEASLLEVPYDYGVMGDEAFGVRNGTAPTKRKK